MALSRRALLSTGAASVVILGGAGAWLANGRAAAVREPWRRASQGFGDRRLDALAYAILAPNPHNMQPWMIRLEGDDRITLNADASRLLPETDPPARQITIGFGAFIELLRQAAAERGSTIDVTPFPEGEPYPTLDDRPIAQIIFSDDPGVEPDPLFAQVLKRHTQRDPYDTQRPVTQDQIDRVLAAATEGVRVAGGAEEKQLRDLRDLTQAAWVSEWTHSATRRETIAVTRIGRSEVLDKPWGITLDGPVMNALEAVGLLSREGMDAPGTASYDETLRVYNEACATAMAHVWSSTATNTRRDQLNAGATWVRLHQAATREGLAFHPLSQALQEFPAMAEHYRRVHELLAPPGHTLQMLTRLGYAGMPGPAPREALESKLIAL